MFKSLSSTINALFKISTLASFKTRRMVASGLILSTLSYIIQIYGGCSGYLLAMLQVLQNKAARCVTRLPWGTPFCVLLKQCGWLSMNQLVVYHSRVLLFKTKMDKKTVYLYEHIGDQPGCTTRQEADRVGVHLLRDTRNFKTETAKKTFIPRAVQGWNNLPTCLREQTSLVLFKKQLRLWTTENIPIK